MMASTVACGVGRSRPNNSPDSSRLIWPQLFGMRVQPFDPKHVGAPEGRGGAPHELPPEERLSTMSIWRARQSSTIRARKALQNEGFAAFVDNVDTRARRKIHIALSFCYICPLDGSFALLDRGHHRCHRQYRQSRIVPKSSRPSSFLPYHKLEYLILAV